MAPKRRGAGSGGGGGGGDGASSSSTPQSTPQPSSRRQQQQSASSSTSTPTPSSSSFSASTSSATPSKTSSSITSSSSSSSTNPADILQKLWTRYVSTTPQRVLLIDTFMAFLVVVAVLQFVYCVVAGNYPFNAFLAGFSATVGQFVLTASLRIQTNPENKSEFAQSYERAFADYIFGSLLLHFFCVNFIN